MMRILFGYRIVGSKLPYQMSNRFVSESNSSLLKNANTFQWFEQSLAATDKGFKKILAERTDVYVCFMRYPC